jgi:hypothetical protein
VYLTLEKNVYSAVYTECSIGVLGLVNVSYLGN